MNIVDTLIWLINFPVTRGYPMIFIGAFSLLGLFFLTFRQIGGSRARLTAVREREGLVEDRQVDGRSVAGRVLKIVAGALALIILAGLALGILGLARVPVTFAYIYENGETAPATMDDGWVTFVATDGETYTLESEFFTPSSYPDDSAWGYWAEYVVVRYLPEHPQAFVIDTTQNEDV